MNILIIQEAGRHEENKKFRESLNFYRAFLKIKDIIPKVWGLNYTDTTLQSFIEHEKWADVIFVIENYSFEWIPVNLLSESKKLKIFWSIDSHCNLSAHIKFCYSSKIDILLNSTKDYILSYNNSVSKSYWFPNAYPDDLISPLHINKQYDIGFCGTLGNRSEIINHLNKFNIKKDIFVIGDNMVKAINSYKLHFNKNISNDINYRTFETTGCGTLLLTNYTPNLEELFEINEEIIVYRDESDLEDKIQFLLSNESIRIQIENKGHERAKNNHTFLNRATTLIDIIKEHI